MNAAPVTDPSPAAGPGPAAGPDPAAGPRADRPHGPAPARRPGSWVAIVAIVVGSVLALIALGQGIVRGIGSFAPTSATDTASAEGMLGVRLDASRGHVAIDFAEVDEARLEVSSDGGPVQDWRLRRDGATLVAETVPAWPFGWTWGLGWLGDDDAERATLILPQRLRTAGLDLDARVSAGSLEAEAGWGTAAVEVSAGHVSLGGTAERAELEVSAGEILVDLSSLGEAELDVSAGRIVGTVVGDQPRSIAATVSAGSVELEVPRGEYRVTEALSAGSAQLDVDRSPSATSTIDVDVSAGSVRITVPSR